MREENLKPFLRLPGGCTAVSFGGNCPVQGFGRVGEDYWYFRARNNHWTFTVASTEAEAVLPLGGQAYHYAECRADAGWMTESEAARTIRRQLKRFRRTSATKGGA